MTTERRESCGVRANLIQTRRELGNMAKPKKTAPIDTGEFQRVEQIKKLVVMAMFSDDELMDRFVLKGGNAIDLVLRAGSRASVDVDLSMADDFKPGELNDIRARIERNLRLTFQQEKYEVFDVLMEEKPAALSPDVAGFWGGYLVTFKLIEASKAREIGDNLEQLRRNAVMIGARGKFEIDISKFEYCEGKASHQMNGLRIFVYTPAMVVCEKLRAICQQMPAYGRVIHRTRPGSARARDFVDIYVS